MKPMDIIEAKKNYLKSEKFTVTGNQKKHELTIIAEQVPSINESFDKYIDVFWGS